MARPQKFEEQPVMGLAQACDFKGEIRWDPAQPNGQPRRKLDVTRAREKFGFTAATPFAAGIKQTVEWYRKARAEGKAP